MRGSRTGLAGPSWLAPLIALGLLLMVLLQGGLEALQIRLRMSEETWPEWGVLRRAVAAVGAGRFEVRFRLLNADRAPSVVVLADGRPVARFLSREISVRVVEGVRLQLDARAEGRLLLFRVETDAGLLRWPRRGWLIAVRGCVADLGPVTPRRSPE